MKKLKTITAAIAILLFAASTNAQTKEDRAPWASEKGYWVVESNARTPLQHSIRFYTNDNVLVYSENVEGIRMHPDRKKVKMKLKEVLEQSVSAWEQNKTETKDKNYVIARLR